MTRPQEPKSVAFDVLNRIGAQLRLRQRQKLGSDRLVGTRLKRRNRLCSNGGVVGRVERNYQNIRANLSDTASPGDHERCAARDDISALVADKGPKLIGET